MITHLSTMKETQVQSLGWEDPLEEEMATHSSSLVWRIPWTEEPGRLQSMGLHYYYNKYKKHAGSLLEPDSILDDYISLAARD